MVNLIQSNKNNLKYYLLSHPEIYQKSNNILFYLFQIGIFYLINLIININKKYHWNQGAHNLF